MSKLQEPFRYDYVGSFLRTEELKKATTQYNENKITKEVYDNIVNEEIAKLVAKQKELGYHVITDGEFRRTYWHLDFMWGFEGVAHEQTGSGVQFDGELASLEDTYLVDVKDVKGLEEKIVEFIELSYEEKKQMGEMSRKVMEERFDKREVVDRTILALGLSKTL